MWNSRTKQRLIRAGNESMPILPPRNLARILSQKRDFGGESPYLGRALADVGPQFCDEKCWPNLVSCHARESTKYANIDGVVWKKAHVVSCAAASAPAAPKEHQGGGENTAGIRTTTPAPAGTAAAGPADPSTSIAPLVQRQRQPEGPANSRQPLERGRKGQGQCEQDLEHKHDGGEGTNQRVLARAQ